MRAIRREEEEDKAEEEMRKMQNVMMLQNTLESDCDSEDKMGYQNLSESSVNSEDGDGDSRDVTGVSGELDGQISHRERTQDLSSPATRSTNSDRSLGVGSLTFDLSVSTGTGTPLSGSESRRDSSCLDSGRSDLTAQEGGDRQRMSRGSVAITGLINASRLRAIKKENKLVRIEQEKEKREKKEEIVRVRMIQTKQTHNLLEIDRGREREQRLQAIDEVWPYYSFFLHAIFSQKLYILFLVHSGIAVPNRVPFH